MTGWRDRIRSSTLSFTIRIPEASIHMNLFKNYGIRQSVAYGIVLLALASAGAPGGHANNKPGKEISGVSALSPDPTGDAIKPHPRLYFTPRAIENLKKRITQDSAVRDVWNEIRAKADRLLNAELVSKEYAEGGTGQHGNYGRPSGQISDMGALLGLAYQMTGEKKYAEKLRNALLHYTRLNRWAGDAKRDPPWNSELNTARFCFGYAVGYDSIFDYLTDSDRRTIAGALVEKGILPTLNDWILPQKRIHALDSMGHNWWSVCVSMAGAASLAVLQEEPRAMEWIDRIDRAFPEWFAYQGNTLQNKSPNFDRNGAFYESVSYANYALAEYLMYRLACSNARPDHPLPEIPLLETCGDFFVHASYPAHDGLLSVNFGDSSLTSTGSKTLSLLQANGFDSPAHRWLLTRRDWARSDPIGLVYCDISPQEQTPKTLPLSILYPDIGWSMMRSSWENDATMLAVKSGFTWNHAHPDAGSFILFHGGKPLIIDSGNCSYSRPEYTQYYRHSRAHNVILIDGEAQNPEDIARGDRGSAIPGQLLHLMELDGMRYVLADATGPTSWKYSRNYRHFLWIDDVILIIDDIRAYEEGRLEWLLHYEGEALEKGEEILLSNGESSRALVRMLHPTDAILSRKKGLKDHQPDVEVDYLAFSPQERSRDMKFITAILPLAPEQNRPAAKLDLLEADEMIGVRISRGDSVTDIFLNLRADGRRMHRNSNKIIHGWDTDAYLFGLTRSANAPDHPDSMDRGFVICGSYLRKNDQVVLDSLSKVYSLFTSRGNELKMVLQGQPIIHCDLRSPAPPSAIFLNGEKRTFPWDPSSRTIQFSLRDLHR
ncbi:MAG: heparinase II/III family protein [Candidatus Omnitrophica bacterium]|nr:heparinase II/III family protein [Candidatus Omnitrophota bacterium]